jgi:hypothetical protein
LITQEIFFVLEFDLRTKNTFVGGQLGGLFRRRPVPSHHRAYRSSDFDIDIRTVTLLLNALAARHIVSRETETLVGSSSRSSCDHGENLTPDASREKVKICFAELSLGRNARYWGSSQNLHRLSLNRS